MWIKGLSGSFFRGFPGTQEISAFHFQDTSGGFAQVSGPNGAQFKPYSAPYEAFGQTLISGEVTSATGQTLGYEVYSLDTKTSTVSLFADIAAGDGPSFFDFDKAFGGLGGDRYVVAVTGGIKAIPTVLRADGTWTHFATFFSGYDSFADARFVGRRGDAYLMIADANGENGGRLFEIDPVAGRYTQYGEFDRSVSGWSVSNVYQVEDRLFAQIYTSAYGRELWELKDGVWSLFDDHSPGGGYGSPSYAFTQNGEHYFTAVNDAYGRELYRLTEDGFSLAIDFVPGRGNGAALLRSFRLGEQIYVKSDDTDVIYRIDETGTIETVNGLGADERLPWPDIIVDFDTSGVRQYMNSDARGLAYAIRNGELVPLELPSSDVTLHGVQNGTLYASARSDGGLSLYALSESGDWVVIYTSDYSETDGHTARINSLSPIGGGQGGDVWWGDDSDETVTARAEGSTLLGRGGHDVLTGHEGADHLIGGVGRDSLSGGRGRDYLSGGNGHDQLSGNAGADTLLGQAGSDVLAGGFGRDLLRGGKGFDTLRAGAGHDTLKGGSHGDTLLGGAGRDRLFGEAGHDVLAGGFGADRLAGGRGNDVLSGGAGSDVFVFSRGRNGDDLVKDFEDGLDRLQFTGQSMADLSIEQQGDGARISWAGGSVVLEGVDADLLDSGDFLF